MHFRGGILANLPPRYNEICMGGPREVNETRSNGVSRYSGDLVRARLFITRFYSITTCIQLFISGFMASYVVKDPANDLNGEVLKRHSM